MALDIDRDSWTELNALLDQALDLTPAARAAWVDALDTRYDALKPRLRALLERAGGVETDDFLRGLPPIEDDRPSGTGTAGDTIGPYRLLRELGAGGMGTVWLAERGDGLMNRPVALKLPHVSGRRTDLIERLAREREILAALRHPNIATLYDAGIGADGQPFLALEYVEGRPIDVYCRERQLAPRARVQLFLQVAQAVAHAHAKLIVHRDLKPSNILVSDDGQAHLLDFGIAKILEDGHTRSSALTEFAGRALTPDYASPEQIVGEPLTIASDVYSLGVILYELLTGTRPYRPKRDSRGALEDAILQADPARPSDMAGPTEARALRGDLDTILQKALKKSPGGRYATVNAFAEDLQRHLDQRPVLARPDSAGYRLRRFAARHRWPVAAGAVALVLVLAGTASSLWQARIAVRERDRAEIVRAFLESMFRDADPYARTGRVLTAQELLVHAGTTIGTQFADRPEIRFELENLIGASLANLGNTDHARATLERAVADAGSALGPGHPMTLAARATLANIDVLVRDADAAARELGRLLPEARRLADSHPALLVQVLRLQADLAFLQGRHGDIDAPAREAFEVARRTFGDRHPHTVAASTLLAEASLVGHDSIERTLGETARGLDFALAAYGQSPPHPQVIRMREIRARGLSVAGLFHDAAKQMDQAIADADAIFGPDNRLSAEARTNAAPTHRRIGSLARSLQYSDAALAHYARTIEPHSADYANAQTGRGVALIAARRAVQAEADLGAAETTFAALFGPTHWDTRTAAGNLAMALAYQGRFDEAARALERLRPAGAEDPIPMWPPYVEGVVLRLRGDPDGAVAALARAEAAIRPGSRADWDRVRVRAERGLAELARGRVEVARDLLESALALFEQLEVAMHPAVADVLVGLGRLEASAGHCDAALPRLERADRHWRVFDVGNPAGGEAAWWLAHCQRRLGRRDLAGDSQARAARLLERSPLPADRQLAQRLP